jgi:phosphatidate cytidylyltransferase
VSEPNAAPGEVARQEQRSNLVARIAAALVLAPLAIAVAYGGGWWWAALVTLACIGLFVEWLTVVGAAQRSGVTVVGAGVLALSGVGLALGRIDVVLAMFAAGLLGVAAMAAGLRLWAAAGFLYAAVAQLASILVRFDQFKGLSALFLVLLVVWVTDIGGYFAGRGIGGPKLWPRVSPKKTWAGAIGGFIASLLVATGFSACGYGKSLPLLVLAAALSVAAQLGDLLESAVKRRFGVKDSGHIIPGHGGLMDRLDGFVTAIALAALLGFLRYGVDGVGRGLMVW